MQQVPFLDLGRQYETIKQDVHAEWDAVIAQTAFAGGPFVTRFEQQFASYCGSAFAAGVNTGTSALHLAMLALGIGPGDEVILPANTFIATAWGISYCGATPVFVDCNEYHNIDVDAARAAITSRTRAIAGVHLYGQPCDLNALRKLATDENLLLIEDAAQAHGALYHGQKVGSIGDIAAFSFYPGKNLGAYGEGGGITTDRKDWIDHIYRLRNHGADQRYYHDELGYNMRMDGLQAAVLEVKLRHLDRWNDGRRHVAGRYLNEIRNDRISLPKILEDTVPVWHLFVIQTDQRDELMKHLGSHGVQSALHYPVPCHLQKAYAGLGYQEGDLPRSEHLAATCVSLPIFAELRDDEIDRVINAVNSYNG